MIEISNIIFFDGVCNFCSKTVDFFYSKNNKRTIFYSSLQSEFAESFLPKEYLEKEEFDNSVIIEINQKRIAVSNKIANNLYIKTS